MSQLEFNKIQSLNVKEQGYIIENYSNIFEAYFADNDQEALVALLKNDIKKAVISIKEFGIDEIEGYLKKELIEYEIFSPNHKNIYLIAHSFSENHICKIVDYFYQVGSINGIALLCLGDSISVEFEKVKKNSIIKLFEGETWIPKCKLSKNSGCVFLTFDGASLVIVENGNNIFKENKSKKYWMYKGINE
ncbi:hypothetical protein [Bacillus rubiinfantis]|uniref:hypothetical protein n=1 Tax=Bacillus rubiinfantis TaxID=1499680 RepID=UPI0005AB0468|nr:hypothetical protein [Bacillus rubiinfantis]